MRHTVLNDAWGLTLITAQDELTLLHLLTPPGKVLGKYSRAVRAAADGAGHPR